MRTNFGDGTLVSRSPQLAADAQPRSLAIDGNTLIVGAPRKRNGDGVAYVFDRANANAAWRQSAIIEPGGPLQSKRSGPEAARPASQAAAASVLSQKFAGNVEPRSRAS